MSSEHVNQHFTVQIDKASPLPYHYQLREIIRSEIVANRWNGGDRLPSESELCNIFRVSRTTVREALDALVDEGLLTREKGLGTFVTEPKFMETWSGSTIGFSDSITKQGYLIETKVLELRTIPAQHHVRQELQLRGDENVLMLRRFLDIDFTNKSLYQTLRSEYEIQMVRVKRTIEAIAADKNVAELLEVAPGFPIMFIENTAYNQESTPIEHYLAWRRGDKARFQFEYSLPPINS